MLGTVLAPLLFLLYIDDLLACDNNKVKLYADDVYYTRICSESDCIALQDDLNKLSEWAHTLLMEFNVKKCEHLRITNKRCPIIYSYFLGNSAITEVPHTKYLGVTIDQKLSWNEKESPAKLTKLIVFCAATSISVLLMLNIMAIR